MPDLVLAIDQGTTSSRAILFDQDLRLVAARSHEITQHFPQPGWVEHDPEEIWEATLAACRSVIAATGAAPAELHAHLALHLALGERDVHHGRHECGAEQDRGGDAHGRNGSRRGPRGPARRTLGSVPGSAEEPGGRSSRGYARLGGRGKKALVRST